MQRERDGLVPIGEAIGNLSPVQAIRDASPQARHHFTLTDQMNQHAPLTLGHRKAALSCVFVRLVLGPSGQSSSTATSASSEDSSGDLLSLGRSCGRRFWRQVLFKKRFDWRIRSHKYKTTDKNRSRWARKSPFLRFGSPGPGVKVGQLSTRIDERVQAFLSRPIEGD